MGRKEFIVSRLRVQNHGHILIFIVSYNVDVREGERKERPLSSYTVLELSREC